MSSLLSPDAKIMPYPSRISVPEHKPHHHGPVVGGVVRPADDEGLDGLDVVGFVKDVVDFHGGGVGREAECGGFVRGIDAVGEGTIFACEESEKVSAVDA